MNYGEAMFYVLMGLALIFALSVILAPNWWASVIGRGRKKVREATTVEDKRLPHERFPRVLNWRKGDTFQNRHGEYWPRFFAGHAELLKLTVEGRVFLQDYERMWNLSIDDVCKYCWNLDASNREISKEMQQSSGYTEALEAFNESIRQLQRRDENHGVSLPADQYPQIPTDIYS